MPTLVKALLMWLALLVAMVANGVVRVSALEPRLGPSLARQVASLIGIVIILALTAPFVRSLGDIRPAALLRVGLLWLALTLAFELLFGHYVAGASWPVLLADYDLRGAVCGPSFS